MRVILALLVLIGTANLAWAKVEDCNTLLHDYPMVQARAREPAEYFLGELKGVLRANRDLAKDWAQLDRIDQLSTTKPGEAKLFLRRYLDNRAPAYDPAQVSDQGRKEIFRVMGRRLERLAQVLATAPELPPNSIPEDSMDSEAESNSGKTSPSASGKKESPDEAPMGETRADQGESESARTTEHQSGNSESSEVSRQSRGASPTSSDQNREVAEVQQSQEPNPGARSSNDRASSESKAGDKTGDSDLQNERAGEQGTSQNPGQSDLKQAASKQGIQNSKVAAPEEQKGPSSEEISNGEPNSEGAPKESANPRSSPTKAAAQSGPSSQAGNKTTEEDQPKSRSAPGRPDSSSESGPEAKRSPTADPQGPGPGQSDQKGSEDHNQAQDGNQGQSGGKDSGRSETNSQSQGPDSSQGQSQAKGEGQSQNDGGSQGHKGAGEENGSQGPNQGESGGGEDPSADIGEGHEGVSESQGHQTSRGSPGKTNSSAKGKASNRGNNEGSSADQSSSSAGEQKSGDRSSSSPTEAENRNSVNGGVDQVQTDLENRLQEPSPGVNSQGVTQSGYTSIEKDGESFWKKVLEGLGLTDKAAVFKPLEKVERPESDKFSKSWSWSPLIGTDLPSLPPVRPRRYWSNFLTDASQVNPEEGRLLRQFLTEILPPLILRQAYGQLNRGLATVSEFHNLLLVTSLDSVVDRLMEIHAEFLKLQEDLVFLDPTHQSLRELATTVGSPSSTLDPATQNSLSGLRLVLEKLEVRGELTQNESELLQELRGLLQPKSGDLTKDHLALGRVLWEMLPGPLSQTLVQSRLENGTTWGDEHLKELGRQFVETSRVDFFGLLALLRPYVQVNQRERETPQRSLFPVDRRSVENDREQGFLVAEEMDQWPSVVEAPYSWDLLPTLIEQGEVTAQTSLAERWKQNPRRPKKKRSTVVLVDVSGSMGAEGSRRRYALRNLIVALYLEQSFRPVVYQADETEFILIPFDAAPHQPVRVRTLPEALQMLSHIEKRPAGSSSDTLFIRAFRKAFEMIKLSMSDLAEGVLGETSNITIVTDGIDDSFTVSELLKAKAEILGSDFPVQIDAFTLEVGNTQFAHFEQLRNDPDLEKNVPLTYVHFRENDVTKYLSVSSEGMRTERKLDFAERASLRHLINTHMASAQRSRLARALLQVENSLVAPRRILDVAPPSWDDYLKSLPPESRQKLEKTLSPLMRKLALSLSPAIYDQARERLYELIRQNR